MATIKVKFRASTLYLKEGTLFYQVIHLRVVRQINTGYRVLPEEWNNDKEVLILRNCDERRTVFLTGLKNQMTRDIIKLKTIICRLEGTGDSYTADRIVELFQNAVYSDGFIVFAQKLFAQLIQTGKERTAETYEIAWKSFMRFRAGSDLSFSELDSDLMVSYETYLKSRGLCPNTTSYYMRNLRAIYNRAVEKEKLIPQNPFKHVYTGIDKTTKRAIPMKTIREIQKLDLTLFPSKEFARDMFMFSFFTRGMSFVDISFLKKKNLQNGILSYRRKKTNQQLFIKWEKPMQKIIDKYQTEDSPFLLPIIKNVGQEERRQYLNVSHTIDSRLKRIGQELNLPVTLTMYVARHSWASIAKSKKVSLSVISEAMGHDSENTTRIYLASLDTAAVDYANQLILKSI